MEHAIALAGLTKSFGDKQVLGGIDLTVAPGSVFGYIGANGAGKTTTVRILMGLQGDFGGTAHVAGVDVAADPREVKRRVGYVPEAAALYDTLTAFEMLQLLGRLRGLDEALIESRATALLGFFGLEARAHGRLSAYSKGMRQKVLLSAALLHDPQVLFLDEPLAGLDVSSTILVKELLAALARAGKTVFYCSHLMDVVERVCDRIVILDDGRIAADGTYDELAAGGEATLESIFDQLTGDGESPVARVEALLERLAA